MMILDYVKEYGGKTFQEEEFNALDNVVLSNIIYCNYQKGFSLHQESYFMSLKDLLMSSTDNLDLRKESCGLLLGKKPLRLAKKVCSTKRYKDILVSDFVEKTDFSINKQFAAICYHITDSLIYLCFRGTDDTVSGWIEDLKLLAEEVMPSQIESVNYLERMMKKYSNNQFIIGGHSKGGNLAVYAAAYCHDQYKKRIVGIYSVDGNGFFPETFDYHRFAPLQKVSHLLVPENCLVGHLFVQPINNVTIIKCKKIGLLGHDVHNWVCDKNHFVTQKKFTLASNNVSSGVNEMVNQLSHEERVEFLRDFSSSFQSSHIVYLSEFVKKSPAAIKIYMDLSLKSKRLLLKAGHLLVRNNFVLN